MLLNSSTELSKDEDEEHDSKGPKARCDSQDIIGEDRKELKE